MMDIFDLSAKLRLDSSEYEKGLSGAAEKARSIGGGIANALGVAAKATVAGVTAAGTAVGALTKQSVDAYSEYQQLVGGVETLFGSSADKVIQDASKAYKTAGMSMNKYMETSIQSAASLINSLGGDQAKASELMNTSIVDMSDNVNKMGTTMEAVQNAYRGFSRGNFTMLDNLALGFAGTKEGMQELLDKAQEISGIQYDISSYADIVQAIHVVQESMGVSGTTVSEAAGTITGSLGMVKAAWENLVTGFADGQADMGPLIEDLVNSAEGAFNNLLPIIEQALQGIGTFVDKIVPVIGEKLPQLVETLLPMLVNTATNLFNSLARALPTILQTLMAVIPTIMDTVMNTITTLLPQLLSVGQQAMLTVTDGILENISALTDTAVEVILVLMEGLTAALPELIPATVEAILTIVEGLLDNADKLIDASVELITAIAEGLINSVDILLQKAPVIVEKLTRAIMQNAPKLLQAAVEIITKLAMYIVQNLPKIVGVATQVIVSFIGGLNSLFHQVNQAGLQIIMNVWNGIKSLNPFQWGADLIREFINGITSGIRGLGSAVSGVAGTIAGYLHFSEPDEGPLKDFHTYAPDMVDLFIKGLEEGKGRLQKQLGDTFSLDAPNVQGRVSGGVYSGGSVTVNVYGAEGQDVKKLADAVIDRINFEFNRQRRAIGWT